ncbi:probable inactive serine/threonine-protein kinase fnkC isoform X4 [Triticum aestivum]|uniref:probable inactive serine/threonine-protein kinase fnkC isoform X4 n=1 Tax=Triticum aestivum TaxID=4565 RepID=UPI001D027763|nr:probable inactive serine/threonine-protein kinase fnkC isoform X4 [Triticum aestivum]
MGNSCVTGSSSTSNHGQSLKSNGEKASDNSCVTGSCLSNQGQSQESNGSETTFKWRIDGFSSLLDKGWTSSSVFNIRGFDWYMVLNLRDRKSGDKNEYVSLELVLFLAPEILHTVVEASFKFLIYDQSYGKHLEQHQVSHNFQAASRVSGISCMIPLAKLKEQSSGFLVKDSCVFGIQFIKVVAVKGNDVSETLFVQKISNICSDPQVYTWNIDDFFVLKNPSTSPEFELCGHKWLITIYPSGSDKNPNYLSLYLNMKDSLHKDSAILADVSITIKDQETGKHKKLSARLQLKNCAPTWGWGKFISLEDFKDSSQGYLVKTKCCIEAQIAVIGSSKTE